MSVNGVTRQHRVDADRDDQRATECSSSEMWVVAEDGVVITLLLKTFFINKKPSKKVG